MRLIKLGFEIGVAWGMAKVGYALILGIVEGTNNFIKKQIEKSEKDEQTQEKHCGEDYCDIDFGVEVEGLDDVDTD